MNKKLVIWGTSGHALVVADAIRTQGILEIVGFIDDIHVDRHGSVFCGVPILGGREQVPRLKSLRDISTLVAFGNCAGRMQLSKLLLAEGLELATVVHSRAVVAKDAEIAPGTVILAGAVVNSEAKIGKSVIVNTSASVDHECIIGDGVHICPGVHLAGKVRIGEASWIGIGSSVIDGVTIGRGCVVGAGSVVVKDIPDGMLAYGVPARVIRTIGST